MNGITPIHVMMRLMNMSLIVMFTIVFGTIGDHLCNRAQILPQGIEYYVTAHGKQFQQWEQSGKIIVAQIIKCIEHKAFVT